MNERFVMHSKGERVEYTVQEIARSNDIPDKVWHVLSNMAVGAEYVDSCGKRWERVA